MHIWGDGASLSATERWDEAHARYVAQDGRLHAVITWIAGSRSDAEAADARRVAGRSRGPLDGVLVGIKDNIDVAGIRTSAGASFLAHNTAAEDASVVRLLREQGAVVHAKLNMAELAWGATTQNATYGSCRNPWNLDCIPGGSSGGSGAAIAAGYCDLALGTDTGASVRVPSALNGVVGLRPSLGTTSLHGILPTAPSQDTVGTMARRAVDAAVLTEAVVRYDRADPYSVPTDGDRATSRIGKPLDGLTVGIARRFFFDDVDGGVGEVIETFLGWLAGEGTVTGRVTDFGAAEAHEHWTRIVQCEGAAFHRDRLTSRPGDFSPDVRGRLAEGLDVPATDLVRSLQFRTHYRRHLSVLFDDLDLIVSPVVSTDVPKVGGQDSRAQTLALGRITYPWALHEGPSLSLPIGFHPRSGNPVGVSLTARRFDEATLFQVATAYQAATDWHTRRPVIPPS